MKNLIFKQQWDWKTSGIALGLVFLLAVIMVKPIGVSTQFVILDGIIWNSVSSEVIVNDETSKTGYASSNAYLNKSGGKYAKNAANPINYSFIFVIAMVAGGFAAAKMSKKEDEEKVTPQNSCTYTSPLNKTLAAFLGGMIVLFGARLAGGCTSGHMMSGIMQTSLSGYLFAISVFVVAIPIAMVLYKRGA